MRLLRDGGPLLRVGHRGAAALAPANTLPSIAAALEAGVDIVEIDVLGVPGGQPVLAHSSREVNTEPVPLDGALALLARGRAGVQLDVKSRGIEGQLVAALRRHALLDRTFASTSDLAILLELARREPALPRSVTYPRNRSTAAALSRIPRALPARIAHLLAAVDAAAATLQHRVVTPAVVERCHSLGAAVFAWTVNDLRLAEHLDSIGVDGVITDDPGVFGATLQP